jgi:hypothetical protein
MQKLATYDPNGSSCQLERERIPLTQARADPEHVRERIRGCRICDRLGRMFEAVFGKAAFIARPPRLRILLHRVHEAGAEQRDFSDRPQVRAMTALTA